jgi:uncharacterized SAM-binding protein YcdF (DUF218 family)
MSISSHEGQPPFPAEGSDRLDLARVAGHKRRIATMLAGVLGCALVVFFGVVAVLTVQIKRQSVRDEARAADVVVVLGAAAYRGKPSPILKARLDHGLNLYRQRLAPRILTTGGAGGDPDFTESETGRAYLIRRGVPSEAIILEPEGESTAYSTAAVSEIMQRMNLTSCIVVSDGYHIFRAKKLLEARGLVVYGSPRPTAARNDWTLWRLCIRQAIGYVLWRVGVRI